MNSLTEPNPRVTMRGERGTGSLATVPPPLIRPLVQAGDQPMASVFKKTKDRKRPNSSWYIAYTDHDGVRRTTKGCPDKTATEALARKLESDAELRRRGVIDPKADAYRFHQS